MDVSMPEVQSPQQQQQQKSPSILIIHHDTAYVQLIREACIEQAFPVLLYQTANIEQAKFLLSPVSPYSLPDLMIMTLPAWGGHLDFFKEIKSSRRLTRIPVLVLSISLHPSMIERCMAIGAEACIDMPSSGDGFAQLVHLIQRLLLVHRHEEDESAHERA
jgi:DNA-binding NarL/FixJ family response regulator